MAAQLADVDLRAVWGDGNDVFAAGNGSKVVHSGDGGMTWNQIDTSGVVGSTTPVYRHISGTRAGDVWIAGSIGDESVLLHSADFGASWQRRDVKDIAGLTSVWAIDETQILIGTAHGDIARSADGGSSWITVASQAGASIDALWGSTTGYVYAVGGSASGTAPTPPSVMASNDCDGGAAGAEADAGADAGVGTAGLLLRSTNGGVAWTPIGVSPAGELWNVWGISVGSLIVASGAHESVVTSFDGGETWKVEARPSSSFDLTDVWVDPQGAMFFASPKGVVVTLEYSCQGPVGVQTESVPAGPGGEMGVASLWGGADNNVWAVGPGGLIRHHR